MRSDMDSPDQKESNPWVVLRNLNRRAPKGHSGCVPFVAALDAIAQSCEEALQENRERIEALPRWPVYSDEGEPTTYGRLVSLDDVLAAVR